MTRRISKSGFTLLEVLVASMLMALLITILTMVFNSSSVAWSTGRASVAKMDNVRNTMASAGLEADNAVPGVETGSRSTGGYLVGPWDANGKLRARAVERNLDGGNSLSMPSLGAENGSTWMYKKADQLWSTFSPGNIRITGKAVSFVVGVWSLGPDGAENSGDDICTWPDMD